MRPSPVDIITRTFHYESFTMIGTGCTLNKATMRPSPGGAVPEQRGALLPELRLRQCLRPQRPPLHLLAMGGRVICALPCTTLYISRKTH
jgi:hypothetical protein